MRPTPIRVGLLAAAIMAASTGYGAGENTDAGQGQDQAQAATSTAPQLPPLPPQSSWDSYDPRYRQQLMPVPQDKMITVNVDGQEFQLTPQEFNEIKLKRRAVLTKMYEEHEMAQLRGLINQDDAQTAYQRAVEEKYPLTPDQITDLRRRDLEVVRAKNSPVINDVDYNIETIPLDIDSNKPLELNVSRGFISSLAFYDQNGSPWPIKGDVIGDSESFKSTTIGEGKHVAVFEIHRSFAHSNALIELEGLNTPISVRLNGQEGKVDGRLGVRIPRFGPNSSTGPVQVSHEIESAPPRMMDLLNTGKIRGATQYALEGVAGKIYYADGSLYIRTRATLAVPPIEPPLSQEIISPTGFNVYKIPPVSRLMFTDAGKLITAKVTKKKAVSLMPEQSIFTQE